MLTDQEIDQLLEDVKAGLQYLRRYDDTGGEPDEARIRKDHGATPGEVT